MDVIPGADGARKVRWSLSGMGKRGGVRLIYFNRSAAGLVYLPAIYPSSASIMTPATRAGRLRSQAILA